MYMGRICGMLNSSGSSMSRYRDRTDRVVNPNGFSIDRVELLIQWPLIFVEYIYLIRLTAVVAEYQIA